MTILVNVKRILVWRQRTADVISHRVLRIATNNRDARMALQFQGQLMLGPTQSVRVSQKLDIANNNPQRHEDIGRTLDADFSDARR